MNAALSSQDTEMAASVAVGPTKLRLHYLDGLRGLAALYVVLHHAYLELNGDKAAAVLGHGWLWHATNWLLFGRSSVDVFIVLSGYCLMIPVVRAGNGQLSGGLWEFFKRRSRRILPPYYAALGFSLLLIALVPALGRTSHTFWDMALPAWSPQGIVLHLLLIHNLSPVYAHRIDYPMWSVATEWQIYFLFALGLLPVWRRFGMAASLTTAFVLGFTPLMLFHRLHDYLYMDVSPHFLGLFSLGTVAAAINFGRSRLEKKLRHLPWAAFAAIQFFLFCAITDNLLKHNIPGSAVDVLVGTITAAFLIACTNRLAAQSKNGALRLMQARPVVWLGTFSYSLYLVHAPILALLRAVLQAYDLSPSVTLLLLIGAGVPLSLLVSYGFHLLFEKPFLKTRKVGPPVALFVPHPQKRPVAP